MMDDTNARVFRKTKAEATPKMTATDVVGTDYTQAKSRNCRLLRAKNWKQPAKI